MEPRLSVADSSDRSAEDRSPTDPAPRPSSPRQGAEDRRLAAGAPGLRRLRRFLLSCGKAAATLAILALAVFTSLMAWDAYVTAPWTRDGRIRVQVASVAPEVSGKIVELMVADNQYVHEGDVLYVIEPFDFRVALDQARQQLAIKAVDADVKGKQAERRQKLTNLATTPEEQQQYAGNAAQAQAALEAAQLQVSQAEINLKRTQVRSPVSGFVTNLLLRVGDFAHTGTANISVIDANSYWIDGYFEETKLAHICIGDLAEAQLMGYPQPILGRVQTITRGISVSDATPSTQGLPSVDPVYTWVRLAQRVPVRIAITDVPPGVPLVSGLTATVTIRNAGAREEGDWLFQRLHSLLERANDVLHRPQPRPSCIPTSHSDFDRAGPSTERWGESQVGRVRPSSPIHDAEITSLPRTATVQSRRPEARSSRKTWLAGQGALSDDPVRDPTLVKALISRD
jgi:multidrug resistance efflux pump